MEISILCCKSMLKGLILEYFCVTRKQRRSFYASVCVCFEE